LNATAITGISTTGKMSVAIQKNAIRMPRIATSIEATTKV
jgi:hypothetical protein